MRRPQDRPCWFLHLALLAERDQSERFETTLEESPFDPGKDPAILGLRTRVSAFDHGEPGGEAQVLDGSRDLKPAAELLASARSLGGVPLVKVAAHLHLKETTGPRWEGLVAEVANDPADDFFTRATRLLIEPGDGLQGLASIADADRASIGWIMGVKTASAGDFVAADGWFQVALESGLQNQPPHAWSWVIESDWLLTRRSLELLGKKGAFRPEPPPLKRV